MRRLFGLLLIFASAVVLAGCAGVDGQKAQALLLQADTAQKALSSMQFTMRMTVDAEGQEAVVQMAGGGYLKGPQAGDVYLTMSGQGPGTPLNALVVKRGDQVTVTENGQTQILSLAQADAQLQGRLSSMLNSGYDFAQYVKSVTVTTTTLPDGEAADEIVGVLDTSGAVGSLGKGLGLGSLAGLGDTRAVLTISRKTHLVTTALIDMGMTILGKKATISIAYGMTGANVPIAFPAA